MIDPIEGRLEEVKRLSIELNLFTVFLNTLNVFLVFAILLRIFGISAFLAVCPAVIYGAIAFIYSLSKINSMKQVVSKYPSLDERLQTANDNKKTRNIIVESLIRDVSRSMDTMRASAFLDTGVVTSKAVLSVVLIFSFLTINFINIEDLGLNLGRFIDQGIINQIEDLTGFDIFQDESFQPGEDDTFETKHKVEDDMLGGDVGGELPGVNEGPIPGFGGGTGQEGNPDIYGDVSSAKIEGKNIDMEMHPEYGGEIKIKDVNEERIRRDDDGTLKGKSAEIPEQDPVEYRELIRRYFQSLQDIEQD